MSYYAIVLAVLGRAVVGRAMVTALAGATLAGACGLLSARALFRWSSTRQQGLNGSCSPAML